MSRFASVVKTTINDVQLNKINQLKVKGMYNNNYLDYDEIDYNVPEVTTEPRYIITSTCTKSSDLSEIYLNQIYGYYPHSTITTTTSTSNQSAETIND